MFKAFFNYILPISAAAVIMFVVLPNIGGNVEVLVEKIAIDWDLPLLGTRLILTAVLALALLIIIGLTAKIAVWLAIILIIVAIFAPAALGNLPIVGEDVKQYVQEKIIDKQ